MFLINLDEVHVRERVKTPPDGKVDLGGVGDGRFAILVYKAGFATGLQLFSGTLTGDIKLIPCAAAGFSECSPSELSARAQEPFR